MAAIVNEVRTPVVLSLARGELLREWEFDGDTRRVSLHRTEQDWLILQVFNSATKESSRRFLKESGPTYESHVLRNMHAELASSENQPACAAFLIFTRSVQVGKSYGGAGGEVEVRLLKAPSGRLTWAALNVITNKANAWLAQLECSESALNENCISGVQYDDQGVPTDVTLASKKIHSWNIGGKIVSLYRGRNNLEAEVLLSLGEMNRFPIPFPPDRTIEACIENLRRLQPIVQDNGSVAFIRQNDNQRTRFQSELSDSNEDFVDLNTWAVRLVNTGVSRLEQDPLCVLTWGGHAVILIEGVNQNGYFIEYGHLYFNGTRAVVKLSLITESFMNLKRNMIQGLSPNAWLKPSLEVEKLRISILNDKNKLEQDPSHIPFTYFFGFDRKTIAPVAHLGRMLRNLVSGRRLSEKPHSCISWAKEKLDEVDINYLSTFSLRKIFALDYMLAPKLFLDSSSSHKEFLERPSTNPNIHRLPETP